MTDMKIGYLLRSSTSGFVAGCAVSQLGMPRLGALIRAPLEENYQVYGLIVDIRIEDDGLVRQLVTADALAPEVMRDNRERRIVPVEMEILSVGWQKDGCISHLLPPRPPLSLDAIHLCTDDELAEFTSAGNFGWFRHILRAADFPMGEVLAAHLQQAGDVHTRRGDSAWLERASRELITLLRDDYPALMSVLSTLGEVFPPQA